MSKNLMVISQKVFSPASFIARKFNKKKHRKHQLGVDLEVVQEKSQLSGYTSTDADANSLADADFSWRAEHGDHSPTVESVVDCPLIDELEASTQHVVDFSFPGSLNRETTLLGSSADMMEVQPETNSHNDIIDPFIKGVTVKAVECHVALRASNDLLTKNQDQELTETYALREKVSELEKIVSQQADEIACLKSAMADNLRRLKLLEDSRSKKNKTVNSMLTISIDENDNDPLLSPNSYSNVTNYSLSKSMVHLSTQASPRSSVSNSVALLNTNSLVPNSRRSTGQRTKRYPDVTPVRTTNSIGRFSSGKHSSARQSANSSTPSINHIGLNKMSKSVTKSFTIPLSTTKTKLTLPKSIDKKNLKKSQLMSNPWRPAGTPNPEFPVVEKLEPVKHNKEYLKVKAQSPPPVSSVSYRYRLNTGIKETIYNKDEGSLKIYIKGRPIILSVPTYAQPIDLELLAPAAHETLKLEWVYGYRGRDSRNNVYFLPTGEIVYFIAAVVILYNMEEQTQRHYLGHTDDVKSIAIHPDKITIATGQVAGHSKNQGKHKSTRFKYRSDLSSSIPEWPHIRIWSSVNLNTLHVVGLGDFERSICCLSFSKADGGMLICAVDEANEHVLSIWQWEKERRIVEAKSSTEPILSVDFHPLNNKSIITCGKNHLTFWNFEDNQLSKKQAVYEKNEKPKFILCQAFLDNGELVTGDSSGNIILWNMETHKVEKIVTTAHEGPIFSLLLTKNSTLLSGGGKDRKIKEWSSLLACIGCEKTLPEIHGAIRMLSQGPGGMILVGSTKSSILQFHLQSNSQSMEFRSIVDGHVEEMWGLATHPKQHRFVTVGYDKLLCYWDSLTRTLIWRKEFTENLHSVCFHPLFEVIIIGCCAGRWMVIDTITREMVGVHTDGNEKIECVQFSTDGRSLAIGSRDNSIYVYNVSDNGYKYSRNGKCVGHSSFITHIDWSTNGQFLRSNSGDYEVLYWNSSTCRQVQSNDQIRDIDWATVNCTIDWSTAGIWSEGMDGTDINAVDKGHHLPVLCSADDFGRVNLYSYPFPNSKVPHHQFRGHSSHVTNVKFLFDDSRVISSGGKDSSIMQWEVL